MANRWYALSVSSNFDFKVADQIRAAAERAGLQEQFGEVKVPVKQFIEIHEGKQTVVERRTMPGYLLVNMEMNDHTFHLVKNIYRVRDFLGPPGRPSPLSDEEVEGLIEPEEPTIQIHFEVGEEVMVTDGPFEGWHGLVEEVNEDQSRLIIGVSIFGRMTQIDLGFDQVSRDG